MTGNIRWSASKWLENGRYESIMAGFGQKGGLARGKLYKPIIAKVINLYINHPELNQEEIATECNVSQAFVSIHTRGLKKLRKGKRVPYNELIQIIDFLRNKDELDKRILDSIILNQQDDLEDEYKL